MVCAPTKMSLVKTLDHNLFHNFHFEYKKYTSKKVLVASPTPSSTTRSYGVAKQERARYTAP
jgi:hypothetical protein